MLQFAMAMAYTQHSAVHNALADMIILAFCFLLHPGEYVLSNSEYAAPFHLQEVHLFSGNFKLDLLHTPKATLWGTTYVGLEFMNKKNGVKGKIIGLGKSGSDVWCPVLASIHCIIALHHDNAKLTTTLHAYKCNDQWWGIAASHITSQVHAAAQAMGTQYGINAPDISA